MNEELKIIENELVPVYETSTGEKVVNGRELWTVLKSKRQFANWINERLEDCDANENIDYIRFNKKVKANNATMIEYIIKLDTAKEMAMLERNEIGKQVRRYFIKIEKKYKEQLYSQLLIKYDNKIQDMENRIEKLENTMTIDYEQQNNLRKLGNVTVVDTLGGYETRAYLILNKKIFASLWNDYKNYFKVNSYINTPRTKYDEAKNYIKTWYPDRNSLSLIQILNNQN